MIIWPNVFLNSLNKTLKLHTELVNPFTLWRVWIEIHFLLHGQLFEEKKQKQMIRSSQKLLILNCVWYSCKPYVQEFQVKRWKMNDVKTDGKRVFGFSFSSSTYMLCAPPIYVQFIKKRNWICRNITISYMQYLILVLPDTCAFRFPALVNLDDKKIFGLFKMRNIPMTILFSHCEVLHIRLSMVSNYVLYIV